MATRSCPQCGAQYVASVRRCIDCDLILTDDVETDAEEAGPGSVGEPLGEGDQIGYELDGWGNQLKVTLEGMLDRAGIRRVWEAGALVVSAADEDAVDELIATLEGEEVLELADDDDIERVAFEIEDLDPDVQAELDARLLADGVAHAWTHDGELVVAAVDEERVAAIIDAALEGVDDGDDDGLAAHEALSALYVATDRLLKAPFDPKLGDAYTAAVSDLDHIAVPYGFSAEDWADLRVEVETVARLVRPGTTDDGEAGSETVEEAEAEADDEGEGEGEVDGGEADDTAETAETPGEGDGDEPGPDEAPAADRARSAIAALRARLLDFV